MEMAMYTLLGALTGVLIFVLGGKWERRKMTKEFVELVSLAVLAAFDDTEVKSDARAEPEDDKLRDQWENLMNYNGTKQRGE